MLAGTALARQLLGGCAAIGFMTGLENKKGAQNVPLFTPRTLGCASPEDASSAASQLQQHLGSDSPRPVQFHAGSWAVRGPGHSRRSRFEPGNTDRGSGGRPAWSSFALFPI